MRRPEIRNITFTDFKRRMGHEIKFVTQEKGHLWLAFRGHFRAVIIPMRDIALLNELQGRDFEDILHKANNRQARMVRAAYRQDYYYGDIIEDGAPEVPDFRMSETEWKACQEYWYKQKGPITGLRKYTPPEGY